MLIPLPRSYFPPTTVQHVPNPNQYVDLFKVAQFGGKQAFALVQKVPKPDALVSVRIAASSLVRVSFRDDRKLEWRFCGKRDSERHELEDMEQRVLKLDSETCGESTEVSELVFAKTSTSSYCCSSNCTVKVIEFIRYICTLFNAPVDYLQICPSKLLHLEEIQSVEMLKKSRKVVVPEGTASHEEMHRILGGFESYMMEILCNPEPNFSYDRTISFQMFEVYAGSWFKGPMLLNLVNCELLYLNGCRIEEKHVNIFLREWFKKGAGCGTILSLRISPKCETYDCKDVYEPSCQQKWDLDKITQGLSRFEKPFLTTDPYRSTSRVRRFRRRIDGTIIKVEKLRYVIDIRGRPQQDLYPHFGC